jgi:tetratricopeptide (TPR) repeat protein
MLDWLEMPKGKRDGDVEEDVRRLRPAEELMRSGERLYYEGEFLLAAREFRSARRHDPSFFEAWAAEVEARLRGGDVPQAAASADEALGTYGQVPIFYAAKALVLAHQGYIEAALQHADIPVQHQEGSMFAWLSRAEVLLASGAGGILRGAETCFQKACEQDPTHWRAPFRAAMALLQWGYTERALERLSTVAQSIPDNALVWKLLGDCQRQLGHPAAARDAYQLALARRAGYDAAREALRSMTLWGRIRASLARIFKRTRNP